MSSLTRKFLKNFRKLMAPQQLQTGFTMLEAVVVVGVLLAIAVGGFFAYGPITNNAKSAATKSAASSVYTAILVAQSDGDPSTKASDVVDSYNSSNTKLRAEIREAGTEATVPAMSATGYAPTSDNDFCVRVTNLETPTIFAEMGNCKVDAAPVTPTPTPTAPPVVTASYMSSWGVNSQGQFGDGTSASSTSPVNAMSTGALSGKSASLVATGDGFTCGLFEGQVFCSGRGDQGQLGNGSATSSLVPVAVTSTGVLKDKTITALEAGRYHACVIADGKAYCWGYNVQGQLGNGTYTRSLAPVAVTATGVLAGKTVTSLTSATSDGTCAIADGKAYCWGLNNYGQLGNGNTSNSNVPVAVSTTGVLSGKTITALESGSGSVCAIADSKIYCWGVNNYGQLGNGNTTNSFTPVAVTTSGMLAGKTVTSISARDSHFCSIADGKAYCWGFNNYGQLGTGTTANSSVPMAVTTSGVLAGKTVTFIANGWYHSCVIADGKGYCWGDNAQGKLGNGTATNSSVPVAVSTTGVLQNKTIVSIDPSLTFTTAIYK